jgi:hypothetical protein
LVNGEKYQEEVACGTRKNNNDNDDDGDNNNNNNNNFMARLSIT